MMPMIRTSLMLPAPLRQRLVILSRRRGQTFSELARDLFRQALTGEEKDSVAQTYQALDGLEGIGGEDVTDASTTIDAVLYGEKGAWRGDSGEDGLWLMSD
jgi:hypothetical protein